MLFIAHLGCIAGNAVWGSNLTGGSNPPLSASCSIPWTYVNRFAKYRSRGPGAEQRLDVSEFSRGYVGGAEAVGPAHAPERGARTMPSFFMRLRSVLGWRPKTFAAPRGPSITQSDFSRAVRMWFRVLDSRLSSGGVGPTPVAPGPSLAELDGLEGPSFAARVAITEANTSGSSSSVGPFDRITARSRIFSNSRIFPGQG